MSSTTLTSSFSSIYFSHLLNKKVSLSDGSRFGKLEDIIVLNETHPKIVGAIVKSKEGAKHCLSWDGFVISEEDHEYELVCRRPSDLTLPNDAIHLKRQILDKQIVDMNDKKLVRVNDIRLIFLSSGTFLVAVDVDWSGLFRRLGMIEFANAIFRFFNRTIPNHLIRWDDIGILSHNFHNLKLSVTYARLHKLHPSDLSDIIEDLDAKTGKAVFESLDHEKAADVLEEMEDEAKVNLIEALPVEKVADVLEKMPVDEVADILDDLKMEKAEKLLQEMEGGISTEVRELMEYQEGTAGSLMTTEFLSFTEDTTAELVLYELRRLKPEAEAIYSLFVIDQDNKLIGTVSLRDLAVAEPTANLSFFMKRNPIFIHDTDEIESLADLISKYRLLALPVVSTEKTLIGSIVIDDVIYEMLREKKTLI